MSTKTGNQIIELRAVLLEKKTSNLCTMRGKKLTGSNLVRYDGVQVRQIGLSIKIDGEETFFKSAEAKSAV